MQSDLRRPLFLWYNAYCVGGPVAQRQIRLRLTFKALMFTVYVLRSKTSGKIYIGQTDNLAKRLRQHNDSTFNKRSYTKLSGKQWDVVYRESYTDRKAAIKREKYMKSHIGRDWLKEYVLGP